MMASGMNGQSFAFTTLPMTRRKEKCKYFEKV
jgi:hypothetical protein